MNDNKLTLIRSQFYASDKGFTAIYRDLKEIHNRDYVRTPDILFEINKKGNNSGELKFYSEDGKFVLIFTVKSNGEEHTDFYYEGKLREEHFTVYGSYHRNELPSKINYTKNGNIESKYFYFNNQKHNSYGPAVIEYTPTGKIKKEEYWLKGVKYSKKEFEEMTPIASRYFEDFNLDEKSKCKYDTDLISTSEYMLFDNVVAFREKDNTYRCFSYDELKYISDEYKKSNDKVIPELRGTAPYEFNGEHIKEIRRIMKYMEDKRIIHKYSKLSKFA